MKKARTIAIANQKGGVGKTTTTMNLGHALARQGYQVLLVDSDPQGNLTRYLGAPPDALLDELYLLKKKPSREALFPFIRRCSELLHFVGCDSDLAGVEYFLFSREERELVLARWIDLLREEFDYILIDTPPSLNLLTLNALVAADEVLVPVQPEFFSLEGLAKLRSSIQGVQARWNPRLKLGGIVVTQSQQRRKLTAEVLSNLQQEFGTLVFQTKIRDSASLSESSGHSQSIFDYAPRSNGSEDYLALAEEFINQEATLS
ncbi:MAG: hypothetical protein RJB38_2392 [Pseudomonadota bacterium]|jgi:chromosome partitioning protein